MSGVIEDLRDQVSALETALTKLCAKSGHSDDETNWQHCNLGAHQKRLDEFIRLHQSSPHHTKCQICGQFACKREVVEREVMR